jgi:hypothetical protein
MRCLALFFSIAAAASPHISRVAPLGGQAGTVVEIELNGTDLAGFQSARFDTLDIEWIEAIEAKADKVRGRIRIKPSTALGPHRIQARTSQGPSNTRLINIHEFPGVNETEPNDKLSNARPVDLKPQVIHGYMKGLADVDHYTFTARKGERWVFDVQSIERGGFLECSLSLLDEAGSEVAFNDDRDDYVETPRLSVTFPRDGRYTVKLDQYRGPQGVSCSNNCGYAMYISQLPIISGMYPLGTRLGNSYNVRVHGEALQTVTGAYIQRARGAEHYRLTFPYSMPVDGSDIAPRIDAEKVTASPGQVEATFQIPATAKPGLWRLWLRTRQGTAEAMSLEIDEDPAAIDAVLSGENSHPVSLEAGKPFHAWTLAAQLGLPLIDTVLELWGEDGKLLAEHDDLMTGQGTVIGNPDSSLYYTPKKTERAKLTVRDRTNRFGPSYAYRLHIASSEPSFQLLAEPEELSIQPGGEATLKALLIKQPGFDKAVDVWIEGLPEGFTATKGRFRADQHFGPSGDGDNINIPAVPLLIKAPETLQPGEYSMRVFGKAADNTGPRIEGITTLWIGPDGQRNDTRRPLPAVSIHVVNR